MNAPAPAALRLDAAFFADPYPHYAALRAAGPIHWSEAILQGGWLLTRHADVEAALRDTRLSAERTAGWVKRIAGGTRHSQAELRAFQGFMAKALVFRDGPAHARLRAALAAGFHPARIRAHGERIAGLADRLIAPLARRARFDFIEEVARPLPSQVLCLLMGIDPADQADFLAWTDTLARFVGHPCPTVDEARTARDSLMAIRAYFAALLPARRHAPGDDLIGLLLAARDHGLVGDEAELLAQCAMLLLAGHETARNLLGNGLHALLAHPASWQRLVADPATAPATVREILRYDSPVQYTARRATCDLVLCGQPVRRGDLVIALIGSANRDPARHPDPERFVPERRTVSHLAFGRGPHVCLGAGLAMLQAETAFARLAVRLPGLQADGPAHWQPNPALRGLARLPVRQEAGQHG